MKKIFQNLDKYLKIYLLLSVIFLSLSFFLLYQKVNKIAELSGTNLVSPTVEERSQPPSPKIDSCGTTCKSEIQKAVSEAMATLSGKLQTPTKIATAPTGKKTSYIPLTGPITTTSTAWVDASGVEVYVDLAGDYSKDATVSWEATLSVATGNGQAFARLFDVTHGIAVNGSEISLTNNATPTLVSSGNLSLWSGKNLYRVQLKSLNSFVITFASGRIKIIY